MPTNEARKVDSWDEEVTDVAPKQVDSWDEEVVDEPVKKKVTPSPSQTQSSSNGLNLLSGVIPSGKALLTGQKEESAPTEQKQIDLTNAPIAEDESTRTDKFIRKPIDKKKVDEIYTLSKQNESLVDEFAKSHFVLDNLSQTEAVKQLNDLYAKREQAKDPQIAQAIDNQIEVIKSQPVEKQPSIQEAVLQNAQKYGNQPQDFNRPEIPMNPLTPNQILERNGMKTANTVGELHDRYIESATKLNELRPELDRTATELDAFKKDARTADFKTDKSGNKTLEGLADIPEAFGHGFGGTMKSIEQGFVNLLGDKQDRIDYAKKRYLEDNILYPTRTKGMATSGSEMIGGVAPYVISTAVLPETALLGHVIINGLTMGASGYGNGYYEMFAKQKQQGASDEEADAIAMQNAKFEGAKETAIGASLPFMGGAGSKLFLAPAEKSAMKQFLATQGVIIPTFTAGKLASNVYQKYGLGEKDVNLGDGLAETAENGLILGAMMEFAHKAPPKLKELYRANLSEQYPSIQQSVDRAVKDGVMDASQGYAFTEKLKRDFAVFNAMPKDITTEQKLLIEPETKQIIELSNREPSAVESPELIKDKIARLQKQVAEKLGTPLTEKETKLYEKLQEIKSSKEDKLTPSEKTELEHFDKRIKASEENQAKLEEEAKVVEDEEQTPPALKDVESTAKVIEDGDKWYKAEKSVKDKDGNDITLTIDKNKDTNHFYIKAKDNKGNEIGSALFETDNGKVWSGNEIEVNEGNRRKGIMSEIYDFAESEGHPLEPTKSLSKEGKAFWENRKSQTLLSKEQTIVEQPQDETLVTEEAVSETKVKEPIPNDIKTAIDNGEITREQVDGFIEQDESVITDIERKAESENEAELNSAIDQADKLIGEAVTRSEGKAEPSNEKVEGGEVKKTVLTKRLYEGKIRESVKSALEEYGLTREVENQSIAEKKGKQFVEEFGEDVSLDAIKSGDISGGEAVVVLDEVAKSLERKMLTENDPVKMSELVAKQAEVINTLENIARKGGQFNAMLKKVYQNSDLGYNYETKVSEWKAENSGFIPKEVEARLKELDTQMKDLRKRIAETELKLREAEEKQAFDNIVAEVRQKPKVERSGKRKIAEGLDELTNALGVKLSAVGDKKASATKALIKIGEGLIEEGIATAKNVAEKIREYVEDKFKGKIDIKEYEPDVLKHFEETLPKITERSGKIHIPDKLIKELVKNGAETIEDLVSQVKEIAKADFPDITDREIRDSITKYGKTQNPTKDELLAKISRMKRIGQLISKLEDVQNKIRPLKSGLQRERMDAEERALNKKLREEMKELPVDEETLAGQIRTVLDARTKGIENRIEDLQREIDKGEKIPKNQRTIEDNQKVKDLREQLEKVKAEHQEKFAEQNLAGQIRTVLDARTKGIKNRIEDLQREIDKGEKIPKNQRTIEDNQKVKDLREQLEKVKAEHQEKFAEQNLAGQIRTVLDARTKGIKNRIEDLQREIDKGEKIPKNQRTIEDNQKVKDLREQLEKVKAEHQEKFAEQNLAGQIRTVLDARTKGIKNRIEDLQREIDKGEKIPKNQRTIEDNQKVKDLREQLEKVKAEHQEKFAEQNLAGQIRTVLDARTKGIKNRIEDLQREIDKGEKIPKNQRTIEDNQKVKDLREQLEKVKAEHQEKFAEQNLAGQIRTVLDARTKGIKNRIEDLQREIDKGEKIPKNQRTIEDNQKVKDLREQLEKVKAEHQEKFAEQNEAEKEAKRLSMAKKNTQNRIEELSKRLREGDFSKVEKKRLEPDLELSKLRFEKEKIQHEYDKEFEKDRLLKRTKMEKFGDFALEAWGMSRILKATADLSFIYVQGKYALTHPKIASKAFVQAMKLFASEKRAEKFIEDIRTSELYPTMKDSKLSIPEPNAKINASEELSYSGWLNSTWKAIGYPLKYVSENAYENWDKVNPSKAFERASIGYLNTVRVLRFADGVKMLELRGQTLENSPKEYKNMADFVNTFTGRASLGSLEQQSEMLARVFFSPRNWASVFKQSILLPRQMYKWRETGDEYTFSVAQKMAFRDVSAWVGLSTTMATLAGAVLNNDDDKKTGVEKDIRSTDFAKIKLGDTRVDPFGGYLSPIIMASRIAMDITHEIAPKYSDGGYKNKDGKIAPLGKGYVPTKKELLEQVAINKLNPSTSALYSYLAKKEKNGEWVNEYGKPYDFKEDLKLYPMMADMIMEIYLEDPTALNGLLTFGAYFGLPVSKYGEDTDAQRKKKELEKKKD